MQQMMKQVPALAALISFVLVPPTLAQGVRPGERIVILGDSITDQGGYLAPLGAQLGKDATLVNRGLNGAIASDILKGATIFGDEQPPLVQVLFEDRPTLVVVFLGINDLQQARAPGLEGYVSGLREIVGTSQAWGARVVLGTPALAGELPEGENSDDERIARFVAACRSVAETTGATFVDLRAAMLRRLEDEPGDREASGILTYDGIHMTEAGNAVLAESFHAAILEALAPMLLPAPKQLEVLPGWRRLDEPPRIVARTEELRAPALVLARDLERLLGAAPILVEKAASGESAVEIQLELERERVPESFVLDTRPGSVSIVAADISGLSWGTAALLQLLGRTEAGVFLPRVRIMDEPRFPYRALLVDVARQFHPAETLESLIDLCRFHRVRYLQLHLSDDQSFTFPSERFPELATPGRSYSRDELESLVAYAEARGVTLIPELDLPGHSTAMRRALPAVFDASDPETGEMIDLGVINMGREETMAAVEALMVEIAEVFAPSPYFHVGGDEAWLGRIHLSPDTKPALDALGTEHPHDLFLACLRRLHRSVKGLGKTTLMWESFRGTGSEVVTIPREVVVMGWETLYELPQNLLANGYQLINASWKPLYITPGRRFSDEELLRWNPWRWENWWSVAPSFVPIQLEDHPNVLGGQFCAWEMAAADQLGALRPRLPLMADVLWAGPETESPASRLRRRAVVDARFGELVQPVRMLAENLLDPPGALHLGDEPLTFGQRARVRLWTTITNAVVRATVDGSAPTAESAEIQEPLEMSHGTWLRTRAFGPDGQPIGAETSWRFRLNPVEVVEEGILTHLADLEPNRPPCCFGKELVLRFRSRIEGAVIRYTLDGSEPSGESPAATEPVTLLAPARVRARCFDADGYPRGSVWQRDYRQVDYEKNLTTGKPVTVSAHLPQHRPEYAVDGAVLLERYWDASSGGAHWLQVDLEAVHELSEVGLWPYWDGARYYQYRIELSPDGLSWTTVVDASENTTPSSAEGYHHRFEPLEARFVKVHMLKNSANPGLHIVELRVY